MIQSPRHPVAKLPHLELAGAGAAAHGCLLPRLAEQLTLALVAPAGRGPAPLLLLVAGVVGGAGRVAAAGAVHGVRPRHRGRVLAAVLLRGRVLRLQRLPPRRAHRRHHAAPPQRPQLHPRTCLGQHVLGRAGPLHGPADKNILTLTPKIFH